MAIEYWIAAVEQAATALRLTQIDSTTPDPHRPLQWAAWANTKTTKAIIFPIMQQNNLDKSGSKEAMLIRLLRTLARQTEAATLAAITSKRQDDHTPRRRS
jgi:hypothetical protein